MTGRKSEPLSDLTRLQDRMNRIFTESLRRIREIADPEQEGAFSPPVDIYELSEGFMLIAELPGMAREDVKVEMEGRELVISGRRLQPAGVAAGTPYHSERRYGEFERRFSLPVEVPSEGLSARLADGLLTVTLPKPEGESRRVRVDVE
jgi:HSP20 family protein